MEKYEDLVVAIIAKDSAFCLDYYLECIYNQTYPKDKIHLYIKTNDNTDSTCTILLDFIKKHHSEYSSIYFNNKSECELLKNYENHTWNFTRFKVISRIRQDSIEYAKKLNAHYFTCDCDNFLTNVLTIESMYNNKNIGVIAPMLLKLNSVYSNYHYSTTENGYYKDHSTYYEILNNNLKGIIKVDVVHCTYFINKKFFEYINYIDSSQRHEYVIFSETLRNNNIDQYIDNTAEYGFLTHNTLKEEFEIEKTYYNNDCIIRHNIKLTKEYINKNLLPIIKTTEEILEGNIFMFHNSTEYTDLYLNKAKNISNLSKNVKKAMEIGFNAGFSTLLMLISNPELSITCFDLGEHKYTLLCYEKIKETFGDRVNLTIGDSMTTLPNVNDIFDLIHIDGGHRDEIAESDIIQSYRLSKEGTILIMDDYDFTNLHTLWDKYVEEYKLKKLNDIYESRYHDIKIV